MVYSPCLDARNEIKIKMNCNYSMKKYLRNDIATVDRYGIIRSQFGTYSFFYYLSDA